MKDDLHDRPAEGRAPKSQTVRTVEAIRHAKASGTMVGITIDGHSIEVPIGSTILDAAKELGIRIPTLCYHEDLCLAGICRVCLVEIEGQRTLQASCCYPVTAPIKVHTHSAKVRRARAVLNKIASA